LEVLRAEAGDGIRLGGNPAGVVGRITDVVALSDESLLAGMANGNQDAAATFVRRYQARVYGLALTIIGVPAVAEEVAQETFVKVWRHASTYDARRGRASTWLLTITRNAAVDAVRYRHEDPMDPSLLVAMLTPVQPADSGDAADTSLVLRAALADLPPAQREPILLMTFSGMTAKEIAARDEVPLGTVKTRVRRGLRAMRERMEVRDV
jgi:RNA polymerase sigma factor (sigma-70 family)